MPTKIQWTDETWNPIKMRCTKISPGCDNCYADRLLATNRPGFAKYPKIGETPVMDHKTLQQPLHWKKPRKIFVESMGDLFHDSVTWNDQFKLFQIMAHCHHHTFIVLTKRPANMAKSMEQIWFHLERNMPDIELPLPNVWIGVTTEDQQRAAERIPVLLQIPAAVRFVSVEPMLGRVSLFGFGTPTWGKLPPSVFLNWVICGGETGPGARLMHTVWATDLKNECERSKVPFFFKKWGNEVDRAYENTIITMPHEWPVTKTL